MEKEVAKRMSRDRERFLKSLDKKCVHDGCGQPKKWHSYWAYSKIRVIDHPFKEKESE